MRKVLMIGLVGVNVVLLIAVIGRVFVPSQAFGQVMGLSGNFLMVAGGILGTHADVVYVVDLESRELLAMQYERSSGEIKIRGRRDLTRDLVRTTRQTGVQPEKSRRPGRHRTR